MALPTVLLKAKNLISKGVSAARTASAVKSATSNSNVEEVKSLLGVFKLPIIIVTSISGTIIAFIMVVFIAIVAIPQILIGTIFGGSLITGDGSSSGSIGSGVAASVVECARQQIGKPYIWAAEGPNAFDCSGLVTYCYREALGVEVPHQTKLLAASGSFVTVSSVNEIGAGDIILDGGNDIHHVGIYTGAGTVIHAPRPGMNVEEVSLDRFKSWVGGFETYRRFIG